MRPTELDTDTLGRLMRAAQQGDAGAYSDLLRTITPSIRQIVRRKRGFVGEEEIEDIVQDVLLSVHQARASYDSSRPFLPWLLAIVRNRLADRARHHYRKTRREVRLDESDVTYSGLAANTEASDPNDVEALREAVRTLPDGQRRAIELLKLKGLSVREAASATGASESALKVATHRAVRTLRKKLSDK